MIHAHHSDADTTMLAMFIALGVAVLALTVACAVWWFSDWRIARRNETLRLNLFGDDLGLPRLKRESNRDYRARLTDFMLRVPNARAWSTK